MWMGHKPGLHYICIWGFLAHVLRPKVDKLKLRLKVCQFIGYPKGTKVYYFYGQIN